MWTCKKRCKNTHYSVKKSTFAKLKETTMKAIGVFCSAAENIDVAYFRAADELGNGMAQKGITLVYGGAAMGLMEATARAVKNAGGHTLGVVPNKLCEREVISTLLDEVILCSNLAERKQVMLENSDLLLALPGGIGTLDEVFHIMGSATIGEHAKRVVFYNVSGFWDNCIAMLYKMAEGGFIRASLDDYMAVVKTTEELEELCARL